MMRFLVGSAMLMTTVAMVNGSGRVFADTIYDNGLPDLSIAVLSDFEDGRQSADDFHLQPGASTITDVHWFGAYFFGNTPTEPDNFTIRVFADAGGVPAVNPLAERAVGDVGRTDTGQTVGSNVYAYDTAINAIVLDPNTTYWLSIVNDTTADRDDLWYWPVKSSIGNGAVRDSDGVAWTGSVPFPNPELAFSLTGPIVPEPSSMALAAVGLLGLAICSWRKR